MKCHGLISSDVFIIWSDHQIRIYKINIYRSYHSWSCVILEMSFNVYETRFSDKGTVWKVVRWEYSFLLVTSGIVTEKTVGHCQHGKHNSEKVALSIKFSKDLLLMEIAVVNKWFFFSCGICFEMLLYIRYFSRSSQWIQGTEKQLEKKLSHEWIKSLFWFQRY